MALSYVKSATMQRTETLNLLWSAQNSHGYLSDKFVKECASQLDISMIELEGIISSSLMPGNRISKIL